MPSGLIIQLYELELLYVMVPTYENINWNSENFMSANLYHLLPMVQADQKAMEIVMALHHHHVTLVIHLYHDHPAIKAELLVAVDG